MTFFSRLLGIGLISSSLTYAVDIFVSPSGDDKNSGTKEAPLGTLTTAKEKVRSMGLKEGVRVLLEDGVYYLPETLKFTSEDSGSKDAQISYESINEGKAVLSGGLELKLKWESYKDGIFMAHAPAGLEVDQLFIDGINQRMARFPNYDSAKKAEPYQGYSAEAFSPARAKNWTDPRGAYIHAMHLSRWGGYHYQITGVDADGNVSYEGGWQNNRKTTMHKKYRMVENIFEELDAVGEWYHDAVKNILYYKPSPELDIDKVKVEVVRLRHLVEFNGSEDEPVQFITFKGFTVRHTARTFMDCKEPLLRSDWAIYRGGAFLLTGTENVSVLDTEFDQVGGNAIFVNNYNRHVLVKGCHIHNAGASGVCFVGDPNAVRNPLFEYKEKNELSQLDLTVGPKTNNYPADSIVEDCLIHGIGRVEKQPAGVQISMAKGITIRDTSIYDCARAGINISEGTWGGHMIERCDVFDTVLETHDHGSFNSWGRDRYWRSDQPTSQAAVDDNPELPFLDAMETTTIRNSRWRCDHGWDIDLDDGSSNYDLYNNLMLNNGLKLREGFRRHAWNNITVNNGLHPHVWYNGNKDKVYSNIFMTGHSPARVEKATKPGTVVDRNFYSDNEAKVLSFSKTVGWDENSAFGDPLFVDPTNGDFQVQEGSPAFSVGFVNFPMDQFGVKKPSLKAVARTPIIPELGKKKAPKSLYGEETSSVSAQWLGVTIKELSGQEFSAYGVSVEDGGIALVKVEASSQATQLGFKDGDLIQAINKRPTPDMKSFQSALEAVKGLTTLKVIRNQAEVELKVEL